MSERGSIRYFIGVRLHATKFPFGYYQDRIDKHLVEALRPGWFLPTVAPQSDLSKPLDIALPALGDAVTLFLANFFYGCGLSSLAKLF